MEKIKVATTASGVTFGAEPVLEFETPEAIAEQIALLQAALDGREFKPKRKRTKITAEVKIRIAECVKRHPDWSDYDISIDVGLARNAIYNNKSLAQWAKRCRECGNFGSPKFNNDPFANSGED